MAAMPAKTQIHDRGEWTLI